MYDSIEYWSGRNLAADERKLVDDICDHGCHVLLVAGGDQPDWAYSVGLYDRAS